MHLNDENVQRHLHGELEPHTATTLRDHVANCAACQARVAAAEHDESEIFALLQRLDHGAPTVIAADVITAARSRTFGWGRWAAGIALALGAAGVVYAIPGSPVRDWVDRIVNRELPSTTRPAPRTATPTAGIAVSAGDNLVIEFASFQRNGRVRVALVEGGEVVIRATEGSAAFTSDVDRLRIDNRGSVANFEISIPTEAPRVDVVVAGRRIFLKEGSRLMTDARPNATRVYDLSLTEAGAR